MRRFDVFNGDADGLCALHQLRLDEPADSELVTGVKRDIRLLDRVNAVSGDRVTVLDISLDSNRDGLIHLLDVGVRVEYFDHHHCGQLPQHPNFIPHIDISAEVCTSILVDRYLQGRHRLWAIAAAFGDNVQKSARKLAIDSGLNDKQLGKLANLGEYLNYNSYGDSLEDLHFPPASLYREMQPYSDPFVFIKESATFDKLAAGFHEDINRADVLSPIFENHHCAAYLLPDASWSRRVSGVFANRLANSHPERAHAILTVNRHGDYTVSVRAPISRPQGSDTLCMLFNTGGGRKAAAGINRLPVKELEHFLDKFSSCFAQVSS